MTLVIRSRSKLDPGENEVEVVERKGRGHPDTICDALSEEVSRTLCRYYLECISQDMDEGASAIVGTRDVDYVQLPYVPIGSSHEWWNSAGVGRLFGKVREARGKLVPLVGYPVRLRRHRTPRWEGFIAEPILLWRVFLPEKNGDAPR